MNNQLEPNHSDNCTFYVHLPRVSSTFMHMTKNTSDNLNEQNKHLPIKKVIETYINFLGYCSLVYQNANKR